MLSISNFYDKLQIYAKYIFILLLFWLSINTGSKYIQINNLLSNLSNYNINFIRSILPYVILVYLFAYQIKNKEENKLNIDYFFLFFGLYGIFQLIGLIYQFDYLHEHYWIVCLFAVLSFYNLIINKKNTELINFIFCSNIFFILFVYLIFIFFTFKENIFSTHLLYNSTAFDIIYNTEQFPRSSGLSRMALILFIFINSLYLSKISSFKKNNYLLFANTLLISVILLLQSRGAVLSLIIISLLFILTFKIENKLKYLIFTIIFPILIFISYPNFKNFLIQKYGVRDIGTNAQKSIKFKNFEINLRSNLINTESFDNENKDIISNVSSLSNNRVEAWKFLTQMFFYNKLNDNIKNKLEQTGYKIIYFKKIKKKNLFTGYGPQADRHLMYNKSKVGEAPAILGPFGYNASNGVIYSLVCSGIMGLICFIIINLIILFKIFKLLIHYLKVKNLNSYPILVASIFSILFLQFRSLFENSFSVFGVDLLILITSYLVVQNEYRKIQN